MNTTKKQPPQPRIKLTMAFDRDLHAAMTELARSRRRSLTAETQLAIDEHLAAAGVAPTAPTSTATETTTNKED